MKKKITIIGAGLSGVYASYLLEKQGITDYVILEAKSTIGGRILDFSVDTGEHNSTFDLGPSWFWPEFQPELAHLLTDLGIEHYPQFEQSDMLVERSENQKQTRLQAYQSQPESRRIQGGMGKIVNTLASKLQSKNNISVNYVVKNITTLDTNSEIQIKCESRNSEEDFTLLTEHVLFAMPPRLTAKTIEFVPPLPNL